MNFERSNSLRSRAHSIIPGGAHTYSKGDDQFPELAPGFIAKGKGSRCWDVDGNEFIDWGMGLRSVCIGHADDRVLSAVKSQLEFGVNFTRPSELEIQTAELLTELVPSAEMVKFAKNGSDATTAAVRLARAATGRDVIARCVDQPFFSVSDWFIGDTSLKAGVPEQTQALTKNFPYNNADALEELIQLFPNSIACVILEAAATHKPDPGFLERVRSLTSEHGIVLIFDEIISGFRWGIGGAQQYYGVTPDLSTFGKAMANGFALSALVGKRELMRLGGLNHSEERVFLLSTTNGAETHALAACQATIRILREPDAIDRNWRIGRTLIDGFNGIAESHGIKDRASMNGIEVNPWIVFQDESGATDLGMRTLFLQETIKHGVLIPYISIAQAHGQPEVDATLEAIDMAMSVVAKAMDVGDVSAFLSGGPVKPVFRKYN